ncbi:unnamed protein product, partial [Discosporangium mesarthrocarpum]
MLPVFRLPGVSAIPVGGFVRRLPREETKQEREARLRETRELERMKAALNLTDNQLADLEEHVLPPEELTRLRQRQRHWAAPPEEGSQGISALDLESGPYRSLEGLAQGAKKRVQRRLIAQGGKCCSKQKWRRNRATGTGRRSLAQGWNTGCYNTGDEFGDRPTPRVLKSSPLVLKPGPGPGPGTVPGLGLRLGASLAFSSARIMGSTVLEPAPLTTDEMVALATEVGVENIVALRQELGRSVGAVRSLAGAVKEDVLVVARACPIRQPRARRFLQTWACERLGVLAAELSLSRLGAAMERWREATRAAARAERAEAYLRYQGSSRMGYAVERALLRRLARAWVTWRGLVERGRLRERAAEEEAAAVQVQRAWRGRAARLLRRHLADSAWRARREAAARTLTRHARGKVVRMRVGRLRADREELWAGELLGRVARGMLGRRKAQRKREENARLKV